MNWNQGRFPSLHHRKEGWLRHQENVAQQPKPTQPGWFSFCFRSENHPVRANAEASRYFLDRTATPPCGDARRGVSLDSNSFTPSMTVDNRGFEIVGGHRPPLQSPPSRAVRP